MTTMDQLISEEMIKAIYLTLFHSLWQGALIAVVAGIIMMATRKSRAVWRYNLLLASLLVFVIWSAYTFVVQTENLFVKASVGSNSVTSVPVAFYQVSQTTAITLADKAKLFFNSHADTIVVFWFIIICLKSVQLLIGISGTTKLRRRQISSAGFDWEERLDELAIQLGIKKYVKLAQSGIAKVPMTIGYFKPVILLPVGLLAAIPQEQIEAILLHELAHIRRSDYLVNVVQCLVEILFFFNPAIWWLSSLLRTERENCCDDIAIQNTNNKSIYINALVSFEEYRGSLPKYASAVTGSKNHLLNRAKRLIYNHNKTLNSMEKILLTCGLAVAGFITVAFTHVEKRAAEKHTTVSRIIAETGTKSLKAVKSYLMADTTEKAAKSKKSTISTSFDGKTYKMLMTDGKLTELYVDNKKIPNEKIGDYEIETSKIIAMSNESMRLAEDSRVNAEKSKLMAEEARKLSEQVRDQAEEVKRIVNSDSVYTHAATVRVNAEKLRVEAKRLERKFTDVRTRAIESRTASENIRNSMSNLASPGRFYTPPTAERPMAPQYRTGTRLSVPKPISPEKPKPVLTNAFAEKVVEELINEGIVKDKYVTFKITNEELIVNGVKQSPDVHTKILSKVSKGPSDKINLDYSHSINGTTTYSEVIAK